MAKFVTMGDVHLRDINDRKKKVKQVLWGDWLSIEEETEDGWAKGKWGKERYWIRQEDCQDERPLEVVFVDVGQGDGCLLVTPNLPPDEKVFIIDAGQARNMYSFISWRFGKLRSVSISTPPWSPTQTRTTTRAFRSSSTRSSSRSTSSTITGSPSGPAPTASGRAMPPADI